MSTKMRVLLAIAVFGALVVGGIGAPAWAERLTIGEPLSSAREAQSGLPVGGRPQGTVVTTGEVVTLTPGERATVGSCATALVTTAAQGVVYTVTVVPEDYLPRVLPGNLMSCAIRIEGEPGTTLGAEVEICFPLPPSGIGSAYGHEGSQWIKTASESTDAKSCVTLPATAATPSYAGLFDE